MYNATCDTPLFISRERWRDRDNHERHRLTRFEFPKERKIYELRRPIIWPRAYFFLGSSLVTLVRGERRK